MNRPNVIGVISDTHELLCPECGGTIVHPCRDVSGSKNTSGFYLGPHSRPPLYVVRQPLQLNELLGLHGI
jgi:hypothetical protein